MSEEKLVSFHTRDNLWRAVKIEAAVRGLAVKEAATAAFEFWLANDGSDAALKLAGLTPSDLETPPSENPIAEAPVGLEANLEEFNIEHPIIGDNDDDVPWSSNLDDDDDGLQHGDDLIVNEEEDN